MIDVEKTVKIGLISASVGQRIKEALNQWDTAAPPAGRKKELQQSYISKQE